MTNTELTDLKIYTTPSDWTREGAPRTTAPYDRIIGIETEHDTLTVHDFDEVPQTLRTVTLTQALRSRFTRFFETVIVPHQPETPDSILQPSGDYNCHRFSFAMRDSDPGSTDAALPEALRLAQESSRARGPYHLGATGMVWLNHQWRGRMPLHSFVGLGLHSPYSLQVIATGGHIALRRYDEMEASYYTAMRGATEIGRHLSLIEKIGQLAHRFTR